MGMGALSLTVCSCGQYIGNCIRVPESYMTVTWLSLLCVCRVGLDLVNGAVRDNKKVGVLEPAMSKIKSLKFATEAAITILRIDDMIKLAPEKKEEGSYGDAVARGEL